MTDGLLIEDGTLMANLDDVQNFGNFWPTSITAGTYK